MNGHNVTTSDPYPMLNVDDADMAVSNFSFGYFLSPSRTDVSPKFTVIASLLLSIKSRNVALEYRALLLAFALFIDGISHLP